MVSTEAGGEGINHQFYHIVFNYDLPWNPMRVEQCIGRIDRIGQKHPVKVYNLVFNNTVEHRVREVLEEKLLIILARALRHLHFVYQLQNNHAIYRFLLRLRDRNGFN